jgi:hypothetical protein
MMKQEVPGRTNRQLSFDMTQTAQKTTPRTILRCRGDVFTELLCSNERRTHSLVQCTKFLLAFASTVILGSKTHRTYDHILLSDDFGDRLCGLAIRVPGYRSRGPGFDSRRYQIF